MSFTWVQATKTIMGKSMTTYLTTNDAETDTSDVEKIKLPRELKSDVEANNLQLDNEDTLRINLNGNYLSLTVKYPNSFICFYCVQYLLSTIYMILRYEVRLNAHAESSPFLTSAHSLL